MRRRIGGLLAAAIVQVVALVLAHELVFLARYGSRYNEELVHAGHGGTWAAAVQTSLILGAVLALSGTLRLVHLRLRIRSRAPTAARGGDLPLRSLLAAWRGAALLIAPTTVGLLTIQENVERSAVGRPMPGPGILFSPEYAGGLWIALLVGVAVALVVALFRWRRDMLLARLRAARSPIPRGTAATPLHTGVDVAPPIESQLGRGSALRAPPALGAI